jgi:hypothetical protein
MLSETSLPKLVLSAKTYLATVLHLHEPIVRPWRGVKSLPFYLLDAFEFWEITIFGTPAVLAIERRDDHRRAGEVKDRLTKVVLPGELLPIYVVETMSSWDRQRLIQARIPFIVPGSQLYLPQFGAVLREQFRNKPDSNVKLLTPSSQALLISLLLEKNAGAEQRAVDYAGRMRCTSMTISRAVRELTAAGIIEAIIQLGGHQIVRLKNSPRRTWDDFKGLMRSPVLRTTWISHFAVNQAPWRFAGLSALAQRSMIVAPKRPVIAMFRADLKILEPEEHPEPVGDDIECQVWSYSPILEPDTTDADPLSLLLSLEAEPDERIQSAMEELKEHLPW